MSIAEKLDASETRAAPGLVDAIRGLTQVERQAIVWRYYDDHTPDEVAEMLGSDSAGATALEAAALDKLRHRLKQPPPKRTSSAS